MVRVASAPGHAMVRQTDGHILFIEDDHATREVLASALIEAGFVVSAASSPHEALALLPSQPFDLIITDTLTPHPDDTFTATMPILAAAGTTPVILLTSHRPDPAIARAAGFREVLLKPIDLEELERRIRALLGAPDSS